MDIAEIGFAADTKELEGAEKVLKRLPAATDRAERATDRLNDEFDRGAKSAGAFAGVLGTLKSAFTGFFAAIGISKLIDLTNVWTDLNSRVKVAVGSQAQATLVMGRLQEMARRTYSSLELTAESWLLNARALREMGYSTEESLNFTEALNNALVVSGAKGERAASVVNAFSKAMALGKLSGDQLETVMASGGRVASVLADYLGVTTSQLRTLGAEGKLTSKVLGEALAASFDKLREEADSMAATVGDAFVLLGNAIMAYVGGIDQATGASAMLSSALIFVADNLDFLNTILPIIAAGMVVAFGPTVAVMIGQTLVGAVLALNAAIAANPIGFIATALAVVITAIWQFRDAIKQAIGVDVEGIFKTAANFIIQSFMAAFEQIKWIWGTLPNVLGSVTISTVNAVIDGLNFLIGKSIEGINVLINAIPEQLRFGITALDPKTGALTKMTDSFAAAAKAGNDAYDAAIKTIAATDYVGQFSKSFETLTETATDASTALDTLSGGGGAGTAGGMGGKGAIDKLQDKLEDFNKYADEVRKKAYEVKEAIVGAVGDAFKGFFSDLMKGKSVIDSLTDALSNLADRLMSMVLDNAISGILGSLFGMGTIAGGAAIPSGGFIPGITGPKLFAKGGVVNGPTAFNYAGGTGIAGEAGPEAILPLQRGPGGALGVAANSNYGASGMSFNVVINNYAANDTEASAEMGEDGSLIVTIDKIVAKNIGDASSKTNGALRRSTGVRNSTVRR